MTKFEICFNHPWLLLLLIPALLFTFVPYFRIKKRYRRTRNRVISVVLHTIVMVLSITLLSGFYIRYYIPNEKNELILLVDVSDTGANTAEERNEFVANVIEECALENIRVGVVTFGFDQVYAVPLTRDYDNAFDAYMVSLDENLPDVTATNLVDALEYTAGLFNYPDTSKIVVVTDGKETDGNATTAVSKVLPFVSAIDIAYLPSEYTEVDTQILEISMPQQYVELGANCEIGVSIQADEAVEATIKLYDNGVLCEETVKENEKLNMGPQSLFFKHTFSETGLHEIRIMVEIKDGDSLVVNNEYCSFYNLQIFNKILILESATNTSGDLVTLLNEDSKYDIVVHEVGSKEMPNTLNALRAYDQIIMNNVADMDLPDGFDKILKSYVEDYGGGLFTVGGNSSSLSADGTVQPHIYNSNDKFSTYHSLFPVEAETYYPPIGVMFVLDQSGSMSFSNGEKTYLDSAKQGIVTSLNVLYDRDYMGVMTLDSSHSVILEMTPRTQETKIKEALVKVTTPTGDTNFIDSIRAAGEALRSLKEVAKRHVIIISDGKSTYKESAYLPLVKNFYENSGITFSVVGVGMSDKSRTDMQTLVREGHGNLYEASITSEFEAAFRADLMTEKIEGANSTEPFNLLVYNATSMLVQGLPRLETDDRALDVTLSGFYGSRVKDGAELILMGDYEVPVYAQWKYGNGMVGSFMADLQNTDESWAKDFFTTDSVGKEFIRRAVSNLMPTSDIRYNDITVSLKEDNYTNTLNIFPQLKEGETIKGELVQIAPGGQEKVVSLNDLTSNVEGATFYTKQAITNNYSRCEFVVKESGLYAIRLTKYDADNNQVGDTFVYYKTFSYSEEYDKSLLLPEEERKAVMMGITEKADGTLIEDMGDTLAVLKGFVTELERIFDPRFSFMITAIVLFLLDIAVCKFKFKWIHEIIRERERKNKL